MIHVSEDSRGVEISRAHVMVPAVRRDRKRPFNVYSKDTQHKGSWHKDRLSRLLDLQRERDRQPVTEPSREVGLTEQDREIHFHGR